MKVHTLEISWHAKEPILSADICGDRLATAGADTDVKIWRLVKGDDGSVGVDFLANLSRHTKTVNVVRFSPNGQYLASASDDTAIVIWRLSDKEAEKMVDEEVASKESWTVVHIMRTHEEDVYDLAWSPDSNYLISGSVDNTAHIWDIAKGKSIQHLKDHKHYVQGVAWDPRGQFVATQSCDRSNRVYTVRAKKMGGLELRAHATNTKADIQPELLPSEELGEPCGVPPVTKHRLYQDETVPSFFRRLAFAPDGSLLITPTGVYAAPAASMATADSLKDTTYVFSRANFNKPAFHLAGISRPSVAVRCSPVLYERKSAGAGLVDVPYRMVYAVATLDNVLLYDTHQSFPFACVANVHYAPITDLAWSSDGNTLIMSSQDGYCSLVAFGPGELGTPLSAAAAALYTAAVETPDISSTPVPASHPPTEREALGTPVVARVRDSMLEQPSPLTQCVQGINRLPCSPHVGTAQVQKTARRITPVLVSVTKPDLTEDNVAPLPDDVIEPPAKKPKRVAPTLLSSSTASVAVLDEPLPATAPASSTPSRRISPTLVASAYQS